MALPGVQTLSKVDTRLFLFDRENGNDLNIYYLKEAEEKYLKLEYLGRVLRFLTHLPGTAHLFYLVLVNVHILQVPYSFSVLSQLKF